MMQHARDVLVSILAVVWIAVGVVILVVTFALSNAISEYGDPGPTSTYDACALPEVQCSTEE